MNQSRESQLSDVAYLSNTAQRDQALPGVTVPESTVIATDESGSFSTVDQIGGVDVRGYGLTPSDGTMANGNQDSTSRHC